MLPMRLNKYHSAVPAVILCERELPDGNWKTVLSACENSPDSPLLLVTSKTADENLWAEVLNLGGYDVLMKPFELGEVTRVIGMAWRQWFTRSLRQPIVADGIPPKILSPHRLKLTGLPGQLTPCPAPAVVASQSIIF